MKRNLILLLGAAIVFTVGTWFLLGSKRHGPMVSKDSALAQIPAGSPSADQPTPAAIEPVPDSLTATAPANTAEETALIPPGPTPRPIMIRPASGNRPETLVIESPTAGVPPMEVVIPDRRMLPFALQGSPNPELPVPIQAALENIASEYADNLLSAAENAGSNGGNAGTAGAPNSATGEGSVAGPAPLTFPEETLRAARDIADQRYRAFFGNAAFNQAGLQRAIDNQTPATNR